MKNVSGSKLTVMAMKSKNVLTRQSTFRQMLGGRKLNIGFRPQFTLCPSYMTEHDGLNPRPEVANCFAERYRIDRNCADCAHYKNQYETAENNILHIENDDIPKGEEKKLRFIGAAGICIGFQAGVITAIPGTVPCGIGLALGVDVIAHDFVTWRRLRNWQGSYNSARRSYLNCASNNCRGAFCLPYAHV